MKTIFTSMDPEELVEMIREVVREEIKSVSVRKEEEELIKAKEACEYLKISKVTLFKWIREDKINGYHLGTRLYFKKSELLKALTKRSS